VDLGEPVDDDLAMSDVHPGLHHDRIADAYLRGDHRQPVEHRGQHRHAEGLEPRLGTVERLREKGVARPHQLHDPADAVDRAPVLPLFGAHRRRDLRVGDQRREQSRVACSHGCPHRTGGRGVVSSGHDCPWGRGPRGNIRTP
jgi:hypothetical protein